MILRLAHLCLLTTQLERMTEFYSDTLGAPVKFRYRDRGGQPIGTYFDLGNGSYIEIYDYADAHRRWRTAPPVAPITDPSDPRRARYQHFCLQIDGLDAFVARLRARGVEITGEKTGNDRSRQAWLRDPDGNEIELQELTSASRQLTGEDFQEG